MQQTETYFDRRLSEDLAVTNQYHHHTRYSNPDHFFDRHRQQQQAFDDPHYVHSHHNRRFYTAYFSLALSHLHQRLFETSNKSAFQRSRTQCTSRSIVVPDLLLPQRLTSTGQHQQTLKHGCQVVSIRLRPFRLPRLSLPSMQRIHPPTDRSAQDVRAIVSSVVPPHVSISSVQLLPHHRLQQVYEARLSDMTTMLVVLSPLHFLRLLRSEQSMAKSESVVVRWIREELLRPSSPREHSPLTQLSPKISCPRPSAPQDLTGVAFFEGSKDALDVTANSLVAQQVNLLKYLPLPLSLPSPPTTPPDMNSLNVHSSAVSFNIFRPTPGTPIIALSSPLTPAERMSVDYQAGKLLRQLSHLSPKSGNFGPALAVLATKSIPGAPHANDLYMRMSSWSVAFHSILESILRDGEDVAVALAYPTVRKHFRRLGHHLDTVTTPSLVVVDAMDDSNLLIQRSKVHLPFDADLAANTESTVPGPIKQRNASPTSPTAKERNSTSASKIDKRPTLPPTDTTSSPAPPLVELSADIFVTGFRDWSHCVFGDPLFASVFCEQPSSSFMAGFNNPDNKEGLHPWETHLSQEERMNRAVRLLLYQCYHAVVQIVRGFYRPGRDQTTQELTARKRLTEILAKLDVIDDDPKQRLRHRRPSGEMSPAKKSKSESGDETPKR